MCEVSLLSTEKWKSVLNKLESSSFFWKPEWFNLFGDQKTLVYFNSDDFMAIPVLVKKNCCLKHYTVVRLAVTAVR